MKQLHTLLLLLFFACFTACENAILDEDSDTTSDEEVVDPDIIDGNDKSDDGSTKGDEGGDTSEESSYKTNYTIQGEEVYTVAGFLNMEVWSSSRTWVVGYIVGDCSYKIENANFTAPFTQPNAILLADNPNERDTNKMMSVQLPSSRRDTYSLKSHPENQGTKLFVVTGGRTKYLNIYGMTSTGSMGWLDDKKDQ